MEEESERSLQESSNRSLDEYNDDTGNVVILFRSREWRGTDGKNHGPGSGPSYRTVEEFAYEINGYKAGSVVAVYMTSDGGLDLDAVDKLVPLLADHVDIVGPRALVTAALTGEGGGKDKEAIGSQSGGESRAV